MSRLSKMERERAVDTIFAGTSETNIASTQQLLHYGVY